MIDTSLLNKNQKDAVLSEAKHLRIIAGAGSGKTRVLTMRIAHLILDCNVYANKVLAITFTNKAANEMKERVGKMLPETAGTPWISTIHSLCVRILREDIQVIGWPRNFTVMDADDQKTILKEAYKENNLDTSTISYASMLDYISNNKGAEISFERAKLLAGTYSGDKVKAMVYGYYLQRQKEMYALDFDDLIIETVKMFRKYSEVLAKWQRRFSCILVDEFQDIDKIQYTLIRQLTGPENSLLVVGDPDQTIYTWRGADVDIIMNFQKDYGDADTIILNQNYRSTECILNGANSVIHNNRNRMDKDLFTAKKSNVKITHYSSASDTYQAAWVAAEIKKLNKAGKDYHDIAILYRSNYLSRTLEKGLIDERIPYVIYGGVRFYERMEVKDALCYLRMCENADDLAFQRIINKPKRGIGNKTMDTIAQAARENGCSMYEVIREEPDLFKGKTAAALNSFVKMIERWRTMAKREDTSLVKLFETIIEECGLKASFEENKELDRIENLKELIDDVKEFSENYPESTLEEYLQLVSLYGDREETMSSDFVQLMTVHAAKGLEFDTVFVTDMNEGIFPNERAINDSAKGIEEERRLAYVAFTRAQNKLYITEAGGFSFILQRVRTPSRFIREIDEQWIEHIGAVFEEDRKYSSNRSVNTGASRSRYDEDEPVMTPAVHVKPRAGKFRKGDQVVHAKFGEGIVVKVEGNIMQIAFAFPYGVKKIATTFPGVKHKKDLS